MYNRTELRTKARIQLGGNIFSNSWMMALLVCFLSSLIMSGASALIPVLSIVLVGPFNYSLSKMFLKQERDFETMKLEDIFCGFKECFGNSVVLGILNYIFVFLWSLLLVIPGIVKAYAYSMCFYIQAEHPEMGAQACITESRRMMKGHKWDLFVLDMSFLGWYILGALCFGVGIMWVIPYQQAAHAQFYENLTKNFERSEISDGK